jgi:hypothetical protein
MKLNVFLMFLGQITLYLSNIEVKRINLKLNNGKSGRSSGLKFIRILPNLKNN